MSQLSEALQRANRGDLPLREIERRAVKAGHTLNISTISRYMRGQHPATPSPEILRGFAAAFGTSVEHIAKLAEMPAPRAPFQLPAEAAMLDDDERQAVVSLVRVMASKKHAASAEAAALDPDDATPTPPPPDEYALAAYSQPEDVAAWRGRREADAMRGEEPQTHPDDD